MIVKCKCEYIFSMSFFLKSNFFKTFYARNMTIILAFDFKLGVEDLAEDVVTIEEMVDLVVDVIVQEIAIEVS